MYILHYIVYNTIHIETKVSVLQKLGKDSMIDQHKVSLFKDLFTQADSVLIIYSADALRDHLFAATALYKTFQQLANKEVTLLSSEDLSQAEPDIVYLNETKTEIGHKNLCISFDYLQDSVEKITSAIDEDSKKLHITIKPKKGVAPLSKDNVSFSHTGAEADMVILVGVDDLASLEQLYIGYENLYQTTALVSINSYETAFGNLKLDILGSSCVSEFVAWLLKDLRYQIDHEVATNLLAGIDEETDNLESYLATADTFEIISYLLRSGARRFAREQQNQEENTTLAETEILPVSIQAESVESDEVFIIPQDSLEQVTTQSELQNSGSTAGADANQVSVDESTQTQQTVQTNSSSIQSQSQQSKEVSEQFHEPEIQPKPAKRRRGRPKGSRNRVKSVQSSQNNTQNTAQDQNQSQSQTEGINKPKPGDLGYTPSGFGPSGG